MYHIPREVTAVYIRLCHTCQAIKGRKSTQKIIHKPIIPVDVGVRGQAELVDLQLSPDAGYKFILKYQDCFSKFVVLEHSGPRLQMRWRNAWCISSVSTVPSYPAQGNGPEFSNKTLIAILHRIWSSTCIVMADRVTQKTREVWSVLMPISRSYSTPASRMRTKSIVGNCATLRLIL